MLLKSESVETPMRLNARLVTDTGAPVPFVKVNFASSAIPWLFTIVLAAGLSDASETRSPLPAGTGGGVPGGVGVGVGADAQRLFAFAREIGPQKPAVGVMPYFCWNFETAARVSPPKYDVSLPGEPAPTVATCVPSTLFRNFWIDMISPPLCPIEWLRVKVILQLSPPACWEPEPPCKAAICARSAVIWAWRSAVVCAFTGVAKVNPNAIMRPTPTSTAATFFVANALLIVLYDLSSSSSFE